MRKLVLPAIAGAAALAAIGGTSAFGHQTAYDRGVAVTMHVAPDDEPTAGTPATVTIVKVRPPKKGTFSFSKCGCRLKVQDSSGAVLLDRAVGKRTTFTFPDPVAYRITVSGRYRRSGRNRSFSTPFTIRAARG